MAATKKKAPAKKISKPAATKKIAAKQPQDPSGDAAKKPRVFAMSFASVYPLYVQKAVAHRPGAPREDRCGR